MPLMKSTGLEAAKITSFIKSTSKEASRPVNFLKQSALPKDQSSLQSTLKVKSGDKTEKSKTTQVKQIVYDGNIFMCSIEEASQRESSHNIHIFEMQPGLDLTSETAKAHYPWTIKEYLRANSGLSSNIRDEDTLGRVINYLFTNIIDVDTNGNPLNYTLPAGNSVHSFKEIYEFVSDRARAVVKDYRIMNAKGSLAFVRDHEYIARFFILSFCEGFDSEDFDLKLNMDRSRDILTSINEAYILARKEGRPAENEAEFTTYLMILNLEKLIEVVTIIKEATPKIRHSPIFQIGLQIVGSYYSQNSIEYFRLIKRAPYLITCLGFALSDRVRLSTLETLQKCIKGTILIEDLMKKL